MSGGVLDAIVASARRSAVERARSSGRAIERAGAARSTAPLSLARALRQPGVRVIAECKRRSPSRGILRAAYDPAAIAAQYERAGAAAISVLTEPAFFDGHLDHLMAVRQAVGVPIIRKDFIVNEFQVVEARASGADAVLLIVAALNDSDLKDLVALAAAHQLDALVEAHDADEVRRAVGAGATLVGVNSRDLRTLTVSDSVFTDVAPILPRGGIWVAESGIRTAEDIRRLRALGYSGFLIGERFMTAPHPGDALRAIVAAVEDAIAP